MLEFIVKIKAKIAEQHNFNAVIMTEQIFEK